jgi:S-adenosylmethionine:tRNA ribosyltransferase-isomerase
LTEEKGSDFQIEKLFPYHSRKVIPSRKEVLTAILDEMTRKSTDTILGTTEIFLFPGYQFQLVDGLITNFHQPGSTLILLISAILGGDWRRVYEEALAKDYRFLSYGDSSLLWI